VLVVREEALSIARTVKNERRIATLLARLGEYELQQNTPNAAMTYLRESMLMALSSGYWGAMMFCVEKIAAIIGSYGEGWEDKDIAVHLLGGIRCLA
jgi:hypothetical protein